MKTAISIIASLAIGFAVFGAVYAHSGSASDAICISLIAAPFVGLSVAITGCLFDELRESIAYKKSNQ